MDMPAAWYRALLLGEIEDFIDDEGRPVGEARASAEVRAAVVTEHRLCPYPGSRFHHDQPMNVTSLKQTIRDWPHILGVMHAIRSAWLEGRDRTSVSVLDCVRISQTTMLVPAYLLFCARAPLRNGELPASMASVHRVVSGIFLECLNVLFSEIISGADVKRPVTAWELVEFAERTGMLVGKPGTEVCAGPPAFIEEALTMMVEETCRSPKDPTRLHALIPDLGRCLEYGRHVSDLTLYLYALAVRLRLAVTDISERLPGPAQPRHTNSDLVERTQRASTAFLTTGFWAQRLRALRYCTGARAGLQRHHYERTLEGLAPLLGQLLGVSVVERTAFVDGPTPEWLASELAAVVEMERDGLRAFQGFEADILKALGRGASTDSLMPEAFGLLPSQHFSRAAVREQTRMEC
jgi:hypothetical protein